MTTSPKIFNTNCLDYMSSMLDNSVVLTLTDIPYDEVNRSNSGLRNLDKGKADPLDMDLIFLVDELVRITSSSIYIFCGINQISSIRMRFQEYDLTTRLCTWEKTNPSPMNGQHVWISGTEYCVFAKKPGAVFNMHCKNTVWRYASEKSTVHPTQKPLKLFKHLIQASSNKGDLVFDPFLGSGTTGVAAMQLGRTFIGCESDFDFFEISKNRIENVLLDDDSGFGIGTSNRGVDSP